MFLLTPWGFLVQLFTHKQRIEASLTLVRKVAVKGFGSSSITEHKFYNNTRACFVELP